MKTTIDLDEEKLARVMALAGCKTRREAVDYALDEAERLARIRQMLKRPWTSEEMGEAFDASYDVMKLRLQELPSHGNSR